MENSLDDIFEQCWSSLKGALGSPEHDYRTPVLAISVNGIANQRIVVLRDLDLDKKQVVFFTDKRSAKVAELIQSPQASFLFYDKKERIQLRLSGTTELHDHNEMASQYWGGVSDEGRKAYMAIPGPSTIVEGPSDGLEYLQTNPEIKRGYDNFMVIITQIDFLEWLWLKKGAYRRARFKFEDNAWKGEWLIP